MYEYVIKSSVFAQQGDLFRTSLYRYVKMHKSKYSNVLKISLRGSVG